MHLHLQRQINKLKKMVLQLSAMVEEAVVGAIRAVHDGDTAAAKRIVEADQKIDLMEVDIEEECLHTLALHQPVAFDLRYVVAILKINNDLERIADLAGNIAKQAIHLTNSALDSDWQIPPQLSEMAQTTQSMLKQCLDSLINIDTDLAQSVRETDDQVDEIHRKLRKTLEQNILDHPEHASKFIGLLGVSRNLERIADHAENIAEDVLYLAKGEIFRHEHLIGIDQESAEERG